MGQGCHEADYDRRSLDLEDWKAAVRKVQAELAPATQHLLVSHLLLHTKLELTFQYRAFGIDNRVARLNYDIGRDREWPNPYLLSGIIRRIVYPIKGFLTLIKKAIVYLGRYIREQICVSSHTGNTEGDVESGEGVRREEAEVPEASSSESPAEKAMVEFRGSLRKSFSDAERVKIIMNWVRAWADGR